MLLAAIIGLVPGLFADRRYLFGVKRGYHAREKLRSQNLVHTENSDTCRNNCRSGERTGRELTSDHSADLGPLVQSEQLAFKLSDLRAG